MPITNAQSPSEVAVTKKSEFKAPHRQFWSERLGNESPDELAAFRQWLPRDPWLRAAEEVKALLKRFLKPLPNGRAEKPH
jgi:ferric-dicitrate binding protein FerR (iron transport regulator)